MEEYGALSLLPAFLVVVTAVLSRRPLESLLLGTVVGLVMVSPDNLVPEFAKLLSKVMVSDTIAWIICVCGLMGSIIVLLARTGATLSFANLISRYAHTRRRALLSTWLLGLLIFIDDYLNALAVSASMKNLTDRHGVSRPMLAYIVDSTAAPICILVPISTWAVFFVGVLEGSGVAEKGDGFALYISAIPYMLYAWITVAIVPLVAAGYIPLLGSMKKAEGRQSADLSQQPPIEEIPMGVHPWAKAKSVSPLNFIVCLVTLVAAAWVYDIDVLVGVLFALAVSTVLFGAQKLMPWGDIFDAVLDGIKLMVPALSIVVVAFMFKDVNDQLGLPEYVVATVQPIMSPKLLPLVTFLAMGLIAFGTGSFWGILAIAVPVVVPLAQGLGVSIPLVLGALLSASSFGSHACFYSDSTVLAAQGSGCGVIEHAVTQLPYILIAATLAGIGLTILA